MISTSLLKEAGEYTPTPTDAVLREDTRSIRWRCTLCGKCCKSYTPFVLPDDVELISKFRHWPMSKFITLYQATDFDRTLTEDEQRYLFRTKQGLLALCLSRTVLPDGDIACIFLRDNMCSIHPYRPFICRQYPFQPEDQMDLERPFRLMDDVCFGNHADDETVDEDSVRHNYCTFYQRQENYLKRVREWNDDPLSHTRDIKNFLKFIKLK